MIVSKFSRPFMLNLVWVLFLSSAGDAASADSDAENKSVVAPQTETETKQPTDYEALIDSLADRINIVPAIVKGPRDSVPVFLETYDPREQARIRDVVRSFVHYPGNELWPHLQRRGNDRRYALTFTEEPREVLFNAKNETVGDICFLVIRQLKNYLIK